MTGESEKASETAQYNRFRRKNAKVWTVITALEQRVVPRPPIEIPVAFCAKYLVDSRPNAMEGRNMTESDLQSRLLSDHSTLEDFAKTANAALEFVAERTNSKATTRGRSHYELWSVLVSGQSRSLRPVNTELFIGDNAARKNAITSVRSFLSELAKSRGLSETISTEHQDEIQGGLIGRLLYTLQQAYSIGCDAVLPGNTGKKHVGMKFESLIRAALNEISIANTPLNFRVEGDYTAEVDCIFSPFTSVQSNASHIDRNEVIASIKTTSKDRMPKIFLDRLLLENVLNHPVKLVAFFQNDVQRKGAVQVSGTFVANLFLVYSRHLRPLDGVYFCDPPPHIDEPAWSPFIKRIDDFFIKDAWTLVGSPN